MFGHLSVDLNSRSFPASLPLQSSVFCFLLLHACSFLAVGLYSFMCMSLFRPPDLLLPEACTLSATFLTTLNITSSQARFCNSYTHYQSTVLIPDIPDARNDCPLHCFLLAHLLKSNLLAQELNKWLLKFFLFPALEKKESPVGLGSLNTTER